MDLHLNHEGKELRSRATIEGLFGAIAGRRLENARMQMTYVGQRLVIEAFDGGFEGGRLRALGSDVVRGADLIRSTFRQLLLYRALGLPSPAFYHCPLMNDEKCERLAKRHDALSLRTLRERGVTPESIIRQFNHG